MQQHLPFTVLKLANTPGSVSTKDVCVATALTVHGIETPFRLDVSYARAEVATALTVHGIETFFNFFVKWAIIRQLQQHLPFTVLKLTHHLSPRAIHLFRLQQHLPFTVLKPKKACFQASMDLLQQHLPFTVLKLLVYSILLRRALQLQQHLPFTVLKRLRYCICYSISDVIRCNSTYRSRY